MENDPGEYHFLDQEEPTQEEEIERLRKLVNLMGTNPQYGMDTFFMDALLSYYDPTNNFGMGNIIGDIVYRLSDHLPPETRAIINVYPHDEGSIIFDAETSGLGEPVRWHSLEDFRHEWEETRREIPHFIPQLSEFADVIQKTPEIK